MIRALLTGAGGMLGRALREELSARRLPVRPLDRDALDLTDRAAVRRAVEAWAEETAEGVAEAGGRPVVFNCAAYTAVDRAESEPELAEAVNVDGVRHLVEATDAVGARLVHLSTDYVFDTVGGGRPIPVDAERSPRSAYGRTKAAGEDVVFASPGRHLVVRTSWLYGAGGRNFVDTMLGLADRERIAVVDDQTGSPTWTADLATGLVDLVEAGASGPVHFSGAGWTTWHELAGRIFDRLGRGPVVDPVSTEAYGAPAPRPRWSVLDLEDTERILGRALPIWQDGLSRYLDSIGVPSAPGPVPVATPSPRTPRNA